MNAFSWRVSKRFLGLALIITVGALGIHALVHIQDGADNGQHCQVCHISQAAAPLAPARAALRLPMLSSWHWAPAAQIPTFVALFVPTSPRAPPALLLTLEEFTDKAGAITSRS
jgi:hypothetical protein